MDLLYGIHIVIILIFLSIPMWEAKYARYGVYAPIILAIIWIIFDGCPLTKYQPELGAGKFARVLIRPFWPTISDEQTMRVSYLALLAITITSMWKICPETSPMQLLKKMNSDDVLIAKESTEGIAEHIE